MYFNASLKENPSFRTETSFLKNRAYTCTLMFSTKLIQIKHKYVVATVPHRVQDATTTSVLLFV